MNRIGSHNLGGSTGLIRPIQFTQVVGSVMGLGLFNPRVSMHLDRAGSLVKVGPNVILNLQPDLSIQLQVTKIRGVLFGSGNLTIKIAFNGYNIFDLLNPVIN